MDLNLLLHLEALLDTASVTDAARRRGLSPPAMSRALGQLRKQTGDALLVRAGHRMVLTPRALALKEQLPSALDRLRRLVAGPADDRPRATHPFRIRVGGGVPLLLGRRLLKELQAAVDGATLIFAEVEDDIEALRTGTVDLDIAALEGLAPELMVRPLLTEPLVAVAARNHPVLDQPDRLGAFCRAPHIVVSRRGIVFGSSMDETLAALGRSRDVRLIVSHFLDAAHLVAEGDFITLMPGILAQRLATTLNITSFPPPIPLPPLQVGQIWHPRMNDDPAHQALRNAVVAAALSLRN